MQSITSGLDHNRCGFTYDKETGRGFFWSDLFDNRTHEPARATANRARKQISESLAEGGTIWNPLVGDQIKVMYELQHSLQRLQAQDTYPSIPDRRTLRSHMDQIKAHLESLVG